MMNELALGNVMDALVPITRFNRGEANKVFDEVRKTGCKVVIKNNVPTCVLLTPERYKEMVEIIEDQYLMAVAENREKYDKGAVHSFEDLLEKDGLTFKNIDAMKDTEIE